MLYLLMFVICVCIRIYVQGDQKVSVHLTITVQKTRKNTVFRTVSSQNTFGMWTVLYWTRSSRTQFGVSINVWRLAGDTLNITCNFLYCNHQVHREFLITLYKYILLFCIRLLPPCYGSHQAVIRVRYITNNTNCLLSIFRWVVIKINNTGTMQNTGMYVVFCPVLSVSF
jgi:hypothetical protein